MISQSSMQTPSQSLVSHGQRKSNRTPTQAQIELPARVYSQNNKNRGQKRSANDDAQAGELKRISRHGY